MQQNPVLNHKKWFQLLSWTLYFTLPSSFPKSLLFYLVLGFDSPSPPTFWLCAYPLGRGELFWLSCFSSLALLQKWVMFIFRLFLLWLLRSFNPTQPNFDPRTFPWLDLSQWHLCWAWFLQIGTWARGKMKQGNRKTTWLDLNCAGHWGLASCTIFASLFLYFLNSLHLITGQSSLVFLCKT